MFTRVNLLDDLSSDLSSLPHNILTPTTVTLFLAYIHYYTPRRLSGRHLAIGHMRRLSKWLGVPRPRLRSIRSHPFLAAHLALAQATSLLAPDGDYIQLTPFATQWFVSPQKRQVEMLLAPLEEEDVWAQLVETMGLEDCLSLDYRCYLQQILSRQMKLDVLETEPARWRSTSKVGIWRLHLPATLPSWLLFDLLQLGDWEPDDRLGARGAGRLSCTPLTIATAPRRGYGESAIRWLLESATQQPLSAERATQLGEWLRRGRAYRVETVQLLTTAQDEALTAILENRRLKAHIVQQITPRQAVVQADLIPKLEKWLARRDYPLQAPQVETEDAGSTDTAYSWLGLRLLVGLGELMPLPYPSPHEAMERLAAELGAKRQSELEQLAQDVLADLRDLIQGRDAFFPARQSPSPLCRRQLQDAIAAEASLTLLYQSLADYEPRARRVRPYRLEQRQDLHYLHAYCYRAEAYLTFRLDRIHAICD